MKFKLLKPHVIHDQLMPAGTIVELPAGGASPLMEGLDDEAVEAVAHVKLVIFGRYPWPPGLYPPGTFGVPPLDTPPIERPLDDSQPEYHFVGTPEYVS
jgi:hypothetical protein